MDTKQCTCISEKMSAQLNGGVAKKRTGSSADILGPYAYGDAYYVSHVLRYYSQMAVMEFQ